jgi:hypothetical protein
VKGDQIKIRITPIRIPKTRTFYNYSVTVKCWKDNELVGSGHSNNLYCVIPLNQLKHTHGNGEHRQTEKRISCLDNQYKIYVQRIDAGGHPEDGVSQ